MKTSQGLTKVVCLTIAIMSASPAWAGKEGGNGGNVLRTPKGLRVLDLVEAGIADSGSTPASNSDSPVDKAVLSVLGEIRQITAQDRDEMVRILSAMPSVEAMAIIAGLRAYSLNFVDGPLSRVDDVDSSLDYDPKDLVQAAVRNGYAIEFRNEIWNQLDARNRAALLFHEILYAYMVPENKYDAATGREYLVQSSLLARQMVGGLFSGRFMDLNHYNRVGVPASGAVVPNEHNGLNDQAAWLLSADNVGTPSFKFAPWVQIRAGGQSENRPTWDLHMSLDWLSADSSDSTPYAERRAWLERQVAQSCEKGRFAMRAHDGTELLAAGYKSFVAQFGEYAGKGGPMIYLKPQINEQYMMQALVAGDATNEQCKSGLLKNVDWAVNFLTSIMKLQ